MPRFAQLIPGILLLYSPAVNAVGWKTQVNCASDYYAYCSNFAVGSADVRQCMKRNGPRLSKACVEALIADGEISRRDVDRIKEAAALAKPAIKPDPKKVAAAPPKPKPNDRLHATLAMGPDRPPIPVQIRIDARTVAALRNRGHLLEMGTDEVQLARDSISGDTSEQKLLHDARAAARTSVTEPSRGVVVEEAKDHVPPRSSKSAGSIPSEDSIDRKNDATEQAQLAKPPSRPADSLTGKMSLGGNPPAEDPVGPEPAGPEDWETYMQNRFSGGMNYEGLGARFSKWR